MLRRTLAVILTIVAVLAAGWLALRRADIPYDTLETIYSTPDSQFMTLDDGLKIHYTDTGPSDRSALVLVHGFFRLFAHLGGVEDRSGSGLPGNHARSAWPRSVARRTSRCNQISKDLPRSCTK